MAYLALQNKDHLKQTYSQFDHDLVQGVYEGGLKVWECSFDLVDYIYQNPSLVASKRVLELGCGQGLPGIACIKNGAVSVLLHDYNEEVI